MRRATAAALLIVPQRIGAEVPSVTLVLGTVFDARDLLDYAAAAAAVAVDRTARLAVRRRSPQAAP